MRYKNGQRESHNDFLCGLNQNSSDSSDSKLRWDIPMPQCPVMAIIPFDLIMVLLFLVSNPRTFLFLVTK